MAGTGGLFVVDAGRTPGPIAGATSTTAPPTPGSVDTTALLLELRDEVRELRAQVASLTNAAPNAVAVTVIEAARRLGCGRTQVFALLRRGKLARAPRVGRTVMVLASSVDRFLQGRAASSRPSRVAKSGAEIRAEIAALKL